MNNSSRFPITPGYCQAMIHHGNWPSSCSRKAVDGEFCRQHSPAAEQARIEKANARYAAQYRKLFGVDPS